VSGRILLALSAATAVTAYLSALDLALGQASRTGLERALDERGRLERSAWLLEAREEAVHAVGLFRTLGRVACFMLILFLFAGTGVDARLDGTTVALTVVTSVLTLWFFTSVLPTAVARHATHGIVAASVPTIRTLILLATPLLAAVAFADEAVRRLVGSGGDLEEETDEELRRTIEDSEKEGELDPVSARILGNVVEFRSTSVSTVMTPRTDIVGLEYTDDLDEIRRFLADAGHSRVPVFAGSLDRIRGILYLKDLVRFLGGGTAGFRLEPLLRQPLHVPETKPVRELLLDFQRDEVHLAIVVDEFGGTSGLVTIEDIIEEIVGEIHDEHEDEAEGKPPVVRLGPGRWEADARCRIGDLNAELAAEEAGEIPDGEDYDTLGGFLLKRFGRIPKAGERIDLEGWELEIAAAAPTHVRAVRLSVRPVAADGAKVPG
jgi:CBS domain containing-hemolysin-like protein